MTVLLALAALLRANVPLILYALAAVVASVTAVALVLHRRRRQRRLLEWAELFEVRPEPGESPAHLRARVNAAIRGRR